MFRVITVTGLFAAAAILSWSTAASSQEKKEDKKEEKGAVISSLKDGGKVDQSEDVEGELKTDGWPVVFVKPLDGSQPYWVQAEISEVKDKKFVASVQFGDDKSTGKKFKIIICVAATKADAQKFMAGKTQQTLPPGLSKSDAITVERK